MESQNNRKGDSKCAEGKLIINNFATNHKSALIRKRGIKYVK